MAVPADTSPVDALLTRYRDLTLNALLAEIPAATPAWLYDLVRAYPSRAGKGLRAALCLATCRTLGGELEKALNSAVAVELAHNAFLILDDVQDGSELRRGAPQLAAEYGLGVAVNVGNATNLLALQRLTTNRWTIGPSVAWAILQESELMMRHLLEGQAIEVAWIRSNACDLVDDDYYRMRLKKTCWYTCIYPCRVGALIAEGRRDVSGRFDRYGCYLGTAFQIQDDVLNLTGRRSLYGKEITGDLWEGKRTLMLIEYLRRCEPAERERAERFLAKTRQERTVQEVRWMRDQLIGSGCVEMARERAGQLAQEAHAEALDAFADAPDGEDKRFLLELPFYVVERDR